MPPKTKPKAHKLPRNHVKPKRSFKAKPRIYTRGKTSYGVQKLYLADDNGANNFEKVEQDFQSYVAKDFSPYLAEAVVDNHAPVYPVQDLPNNLPAAEREMRKAMNAEVGKSRASDPMKHRTLCLAMIELIDGDSGHTMVTDDPDYLAAFDLDANPKVHFPVDLWQIIKKVYTRKMVETGLEAKDKLDDQLKKCKQTPYEDDGMYLKRFKRCLADYDALNLANDKPNAEAQVYRYLSNVCQVRFPDCYKRLKNKVSNETGQNCVPNTLQEAYVLIRKYEKKPKEKRGGRSTDHTETTRPDHGAYAVRGRGKKRKIEEEKDEEPDEDDDVEDESDDEDDKEEDASPVQETANGNVCEWCYMTNHVKSRCFEYLNFIRRRDEMRKKNGSQSTAADKKKKSGNNNKKNKSGKTKNSDRVNIVTEVANEHADVADITAAVDRIERAGVTLSDTDVVLDCGATLHLFGNKSILENVHKPAKGRQIRAVEGSVLDVNEVGELNVFSGVNYHKQATLNLLSYSKLEDEGYYTATNNTRKCFYVWSPESPDEIFEFKRKGGLYVADAAELISKRVTQPVSVAERVDEDVPEEEDEVLPIMSEPIAEDLPVDDEADRDDGDAHDVAGASTVEENESKLTPEQLKKAKLAVELMENLGNISPKMFTQMINNGNAVEADISPADVRRAVETYGNRKSVTKGKTTQRKAAKVRFEMLPPREQQRQTLNIDITYVDKQKFLTVVAKPSNYAMAHAIETRHPKHVGPALHSMTSKFISYNYKPDVILSDKEGAVAVLTPELERTYPGLKINPTGAGDHVPVIERFHRTLKERVRGFYNTLDFTCPASFLKYLVFFCVRGINMSPTRHDKLSPWEVVHQRKINLKVDTRLKFGVCVHATNPKSNNSMLSRTETCVALHPTGNKQGSWYLYNLETGRVVVRSVWTREPFTAEDIAKLNAKAAAEKRQLDQELQFRFGRNKLRVLDEEADDAIDQLDLEEIAPAEPEREPIEGEVPEQEHDSAAEDQAEPEEEETSVSTPAEATPEAAQIFPEDQIEQDPTVEEPAESAEPSEQVPSSESEPEPRYQLRPGRRYGSREGPWNAFEAMVITETCKSMVRNQLFNKECKRIADEADDNGLICHVQLMQAIKRFGREEAVKAALIELTEVAKNKESFKVDKRLKNMDLKKLKEQNIDVLSSMLIFTEKFLSTGEFEKLKARLVAGGHLQNRGLYSSSEINSPTVSTDSVMMVSTIAAKEDRYVATIDIVGAYLNALMKKKILMKLDPRVVEILLKIFPNWKDYVNDNGSLHVELRRALYGCVQSAKLWYDHLTATLREMGFKPNPKDPCVFNKGKGDKQCTICFHVDDLMVTSKDQNMVYDVINQLTDKYKTIKVNVGKKHSYLGLSFDFSTPKRVKITAEKVIMNLLGNANVKKGAKTPALGDLHTIDEDSPALNKQDAQDFHSHVATLLYIGKRVRPDLLLAVNFLSSRVQKPTEQDQKKLYRCLRYLYQTKNLGMCLKANKFINIIGLIDAAYGIHNDFKSHTGGATTMGGGVISAKSSKQSIMTKSSTEAEAVGLSDYATQVIHERDFLKHQGYELKPSTIYQDNQATIKLMEKGRSTSDRTRHINVRYFWLKDRIDAGEIKIEHLPTTEMTADILTKPLQGKLFIKLRNQLLNWTD